MNEDLSVSTLRDDINRRFCEAVHFLLDKNLARNKNEVMSKLGLYLGRLSLILGGKANASTDNVAMLSKAYGVSTEWLLLGVGTIMKGVDSDAADVRRDAAPRLSGYLPLIPITALAGFNGIDEPGVCLDDCTRYLVPEFAQAGADFLIRIQGVSMTPTFVSGDLVACRKLESNAWVDYGEVYIVDGVQGVMIKRVFTDPASPDAIECRSDNPDVPPFSINKTDVRSLSKVIGVVRSI